MGLYVDTPTAPNPQATAATQTSSNVNTATANSIIGNANVYTPTGSSTFQQTGQQTIPDGNGGTIQVPQWSNTQTLSPEQQQLYDQQTQLGSSMNNLAQGQVDRLGGVLSQPFSPYGQLPSQTTSVNPTQMQTSFNTGGPIQSSVDYTMANANAPTTLGNTGGGINYGIDPTAGQIQYGTGAADFSKDRDKVEGAIYSRLDPQMEKDRAALETRLANQGVTQGSQAWNTATDSLNRSNTDARMQAILAGGQEQSRLQELALQQGQFNNSAQAQEFGQNAQRTNTNNQAQAQDFGQIQARGLFGQQGIAQNNAAIGQNNTSTLNAGQFANAAQAQQYGQNQDQANFANSGNQQNFSNAVTAGNFGNTARQNAFQEALAVRNQPMNEISALMSGGQVSMPQFAAYQGGTVDSTPVGNYINSNYQTQANNAATTNAGIFSAIGSVAGAGAKMAMPGAGMFGSDRRLKKDIQLIGTWPNGLPYYEFTYKSGGPRRIGFMADEVEKYMPEAVHEIDGFKHVDYGKAVL